MIRSVAMRRCEVQLVMNKSTDDMRQRPPTSLSWTQQRRRRSAGNRQQLIGCMSGQRSPTTPTTAVSTLHVGNLAVCPPRTPIDPPAAVLDQQSPRPSKCYRPSLSIHCDQVVSGSSTLVSAAAAAAAAAAESSANSAGDSGIDVNSSVSFDEIDRRAPTASGRGRSRSTKTTTSPTAPLSTRQDAGDSSVEPLEPEMGSRSKRDRKSRSQSPAALWRSISSSSLMRSLSRRRAASQSRRGATSTESKGESATSRLKLSSVDTDSDCENRDAAAEQTRRRRIRGSGSSGSGGSLSGLGLETCDSRRRCESVAAGETRRRRNGIFGGARSSRPTQTSPTDDDDVSQSATLPRRRQRSDGRGSDSPGSSRLSSRAASWASLRRSQTSESLSLLKNPMLQLPNGFSLVTASFIFFQEPY